MTGFLTQLVARGLGYADVAQPRPVSRFEPLSLADAAPLMADAALPHEDIEAMAESASPGTSRPSRRSARIPAPYATDVDKVEAEEPVRDLARLPRPPAAPPAPAMPSPTVTAPAPPLPSPTVVVRDPARPRRHDTPMAPALASPAAQVAPPPIAWSTPTVEPAPSEPAPTAPSQRILIQPHIHSVAQQPTPLSSAPGLPPTPSGPTVHVTIGRLEVRATPPPATEKRPHAAEPAPPVKLDDYLRQRGGRGTR